MNSKTIFDAYSDYQTNNTNVNKSTLRSTIHRFLAKHWGGEAPKGSKAINEEVHELIELLKKLPVGLIAGSMELLEQEFSKNNIPKENRKSYKWAYKSFLDWAEVNNYFKPVKEDILKPDVQQNIFTRQPKGTGTKQKDNYHNRTKKQPYILMAKNNRKQLIYPTDYINSNLANELKLFKRFRSEHHNCSKGTIKENLLEANRFLGWLHRYKNVPLEELSLGSIIKFIKLNISYSDFRNEKGEVNYQEYANKKAMVRQEAIELSNENRKLIEEYLNFVGGHPNNKLGVLVICIAIAKFIFRDEVGTDEYIDANDLPLVRRLHQLVNILNKKANSTEPTVSHADKSIAWEKTFDVLEVLRKRIHCLEIERIVISKKTNKEYTRKVLRTKNAIFNDLQLFLSLAFMIVIPTDRARTYYELEIGRTFVFGSYQSGRFIPVDKLKDKTQALWYIHLMPEDHKMGKVYKEYWGIMPNVLFHKDNDLYSYIDLWIKEGRESRMECNHNCFFRKSIICGALDSVAWGQRIKDIFTQETGVPVTPKELRKMYITYLNNKGVTNTELKAAAQAMHHSQKMQESVYNSQTIMDRIQPIYDLNERMFKDFFGATSQG